MTDRAHILIVDDEPNVRLVFRTALESSGFVVSEAIDGKDALEKIACFAFDLVLLDLRMPRLDGMETLRRLSDMNVDVPVVVVTAHGSIPDVVASLRLGAVDFIPKPLSPETLRRVAREAIVARVTPTDRRMVEASRLGHEALARARRAIEGGECDEADFFLRIAEPLAADPAEARRLADDLQGLRRRRNLGEYRVLGSLTWG
jgi:DNA-binding NtrC family response regulator